MVSTSETGHAKNLANCSELISDALSFGTAYNPPKASLQVLSMETQLADSRKALGDVNTCLSAYKIAVAARKAAFSILSKYVSRIMNILKSTDTTVYLDESARSIVRKIQGKRVSPRLTAEEKKAQTDAGKETVEYSSSQMSFDSRIENLDKFIKLLTDIPEYTPNEENLKLTAIREVYKDLDTKNAAVRTAESQLTAARVFRDNLLYKPGTGLIDIATDAKTYIKAVFGPSSTQYKKVARLKFDSMAINPV
jgi:hypothetical protein